MNAARRTIAIWAALYVVLTAGILWGLDSVRHRQVSGTDESQARADWEAWRESVRRGNETATQPVQRRVPTTDELPATIRLRDHFGAVLTGILLVWTAFFGFLAMVITGVMRGTPPPSRE